MTAVAAQRRTAGVLAAAYGLSGAGRPIGTEHLLSALTLRAGGPVAAALDRVDLTPTVAFAVLRDRADDWHSDDGGRHVGSAGPTPLAAGVPAGRHGQRPGTAAACRAFAVAASVAADTGSRVVSPGDVLHGLLADTTNRATELLAWCAVDPARLANASGGAAPRERVARVGVELHATRDALLGRRRCPAESPADRLSGWLLHRMRVNLARQPVYWLRRDAVDQARRSGFRHPRSEHLLLALLATHEVATAYPELSARYAHRYDGGRRLADAGLRYRDVLAVAHAHREQLGMDAAPVAAFLPAAGRGEPAGTGEVLRALLATGGNRAVRLLDLLGPHRDTGQPAW
ncbi:Clp protease N-terminal domain-containing protein [Solwaraspora sp. WMMB335]|uniref:Clp protease N-terminal domain-containing protein n=1 Tax=Solwaraspora sp. WMMB335 TaxID=3404118 RepID=UPI003B95A176